MSLKVFLIENNQGGTRLFAEQLKDSFLWVYKLDFAETLIAAAEVLHQKTFCIILLDIDMHDENLKMIPVVILATSRAEEDIVKSYKHHANCYISKPLDLNQFMKVVKSIEDFRFSIVKLSSKT